MRLQILPLLIFILLSAGVDFYIFRRLIKSAGKRVALCHLIISFLLIAMVITAMALPFRNGDNGVLLCAMWMIFTFISVYISKIIFVIFSLLSRVTVIFHRPQLKWLETGGLIISIITFIILWWGALVNRFDIRIKEQNVTIPNLPEQFDGYRIVQISDLHTGTFGRDTAFVAELVDEINALHPDLIVFTGDIVNSVSTELEPHLSPLSRLSAPDGVISILGNHDYGDYSVWPDEASKTSNLDHLKSLQRAMGWNLLLNDHTFIHHGGDSIAVIGVENIGDPPFRRYGDLNASYPDLNDNVTKILLTHNPAHWTRYIAENHDSNIALTLSGHTHAMQFEVAGHSPAVWRYPTWGGLYKAATTDKQIYVNIGAGTVGLPARIGANPEITILTLK